MSYSEKHNPYEDRIAKCGVIRLEMLLPSETGNPTDFRRWSARWHSDDGALCDFDAAAETLEEALHSLALGLGESVLDLRAKLAEASR